MELQYNDLIIIRQSLTEYIEAILPSLSRHSALTDEMKVAALLLRSKVDAEIKARAEKDKGKIPGIPGAALTPDPSVFKKGRKP